MDRIYLKETDGQRGSYLALSHCWGLKLAYRLLQANIDDFKHSIPREQLPRNFQDAIEVTKALNFEFIWIDALCIIQDSENDWMHEAAQMGRIYQNASLTIAATSASDSTQGFLGSRPSPVSIPGDIAGTDLTPLFVRRTPSHLPFTDRNQSHDSYTPLLSRAWVYQERVLSPRTLHFLHDEVVFECLTGLECECDLIHRFFGMTSFPTNFKHYFRTALDGPQEEVQDTWRTMVREYSLRDLTVPTDKLPALSAIARMAQSKMGQYLAGLWLESLPWDLGWSMLRTGRPTRSIPEIPSWSWAHHDGVHVIFDVERIRNAAFKVTDFHLDYAGNDPFGRITSASLRLESLTTVATLQHVNEELCVLRQGDLQVSFTNELRASEGAQGLLPGIPILCLLLGHFESGGLGSRSLALKVVNHEEQLYRRIGTFRRSEESAPWYDGAELKELTLV